MKKVYILFLSLFILTGFAQAPAGYYATATGTGYTLKTQLYNIIRGQVDRGYDGLYVTYQTSDVDNFYENDGTVLDMYSENPTGPDPYNFSLAAGDRCGTYSAEGDCYNREHLIPQSVFNEASPMRNDAHFITPTDGKVNNYRDTYPFGVVGTLGTPPSGITNPTRNGSKVGNNRNSGYSAGYSGIVFEPVDEFKGDIARMLLYFATRYENVVSGYSYIMFNGTSNQVFTTAFKNILVQWNSLDPVSPREIARNNAIYTRQNNRNPFIDHPEYVNQIWGQPLATSDYEVLADVTVYPNPSYDQKINIHSENDLDEIQLVNINGQIMLQIQKPVANDHNYELGNLPQGFYFLKLSAGNQTTTKKVLVN